MTSNIKIKKINNEVVSIIIDEPKTYNSLSFKNLSDLLKALKKLDADKKVKVIILEGAGKGFSAGHNLKEVRGLIDFYMENAKIMKNKLQTAGYKVYGGDNAPYIWIKVPDQMTSWDFFDFLLQKVSVVGTPGSGFGLSGEGYFRLSAFNSRSNVLNAMERIINI